MGGILVSLLCVHFSKLLSYLFISVFFSEHFKLHYILKYLIEFNSMPFFYVLSITNAFDFSNSINFRNS